MNPTPNKLYLCSSNGGVLLFAVRVNTFVYGWFFSAEDKIKDPEPITKYLDHFRRDTKSIAFAVHDFHTVRLSWANLPCALRSKPTRLRNNLHFSE